LQRLVSTGGSEIKQQRQVAHRHCQWHVGGKDKRSSAAVETGFFDLWFVVRGGLRRVGPPAGERFLVLIGFLFLAKDFAGASQFLSAVTQHAHLSAVQANHRETQEAVFVRRFVTIVYGRALLL